VCAYPKTPLTGKELQKQLAEQPHSGERHGATADAGGASRPVSEAAFIPGLMSHCGDSFRVG
jgi:hypothetical protein